MDEELRERLVKVMDFSRRVLHVGWIPLVLYMGFTQSATTPSILRIISPFAG
ncbi:hypothetical protein BC833DRAFT_591384 [Globomyces pollinis-pini]|nr:hypothetical protein BC833DRAFT_591384 [Globomyces pollinis-pini]